MRKFLNTGAVVLSIFMMWSCGEGATQQQSQSKVYQSAVVQAEDITVERKFSAAIRGRQDIEIFAQVAGTITKVCVTDRSVLKYSCLCAGRGKSLHIPRRRS